MVDAAFVDELEKAPRFLLFLEVDENDFVINSTRKYHKRVQDEFLII